MDADAAVAAVVGVEDTGIIGGDADVEIVAAMGEAGLVAGDAISGGFTVSMLERDDTEAVCTGDIDLSRLVSEAVLAAALRPQNDNNPPPIFFPLATSTD